MVATDLSHAQPSPGPEDRDVASSSADSSSLRTLPGVPAAFPELTELVQLGIRKGSLSFDDLLSVLNKGAFDPQLLVELVREVVDNRIDLVRKNNGDEFPSPSFVLEQSPLAKHLSHPRSSKREHVASPRIVYSREIDQFPLLTTEQEQRITQSIMVGRLAVRRLLMQSPIGLCFVHDHILESISSGHTLPYAFHLSRVRGHSEEVVRRRLPEHLPQLRGLVDQFPRPGALRSPAAIDKAPMGQEGRLEASKQIASLLEELPLHQRHFRRLMRLMQRVSNDIQDCEDGGANQAVKTASWLCGEPPEVFVERWKRIQCLNSEVRSLENELISSNTRLAVFWARKYESPTSSLMDLIGYGNIGLAWSIDRFEPWMGNKFDTYASIWIVQSILRSFEEQEHFIQVPPDVRKKIGMIARYEVELTIRQGRHPTAVELAAESGFNESEIDQIKRASVDPMSLDQPTGQQRTDSLLDYISADSDSLSPGLNPLSLKETVARALRTLPYREREILKCRHGLGDGAIYTLEECGKIFGVHRERVRQIEERALARLRSPSRRKYFEGQFDFDAYPADKKPS